VEAIAFYNSYYWIQTSLGFTLPSILLIPDGIYPADKAARRSVVVERLALLLLIQEVLETGYPD
jgi:hypothetical protein